MDKRSIMDVVISIIASSVISLVLLYVFHGMQKENFQGEFDEYKNELAKDFDKLSREVEAYKKMVEDLNMVIADSGSSHAKLGVDKKSEISESISDLHLGNQDKDMVPVQQGIMKQVPKTDSSKDVVELPSDSKAISAPEEGIGILPEHKNDVKTPVSEDVGKIAFPDMKSLSVVELLDDISSGVLS